MKRLYYKILKRWFTNIIFSEYEKALVFEALEESYKRKYGSIGETLNEQAKDVHELCDVFNTNFELYR